MNKYDDHLNDVFKLVGRWDNLPNQFLKSLLVLFFLTGGYLSTYSLSKKDGGTLCPANNSGITAPATGCAGEGELFIVNPPVLDASYAWSFNGPSSIKNSTEPNVIVHWTTAGAYEISLTVSHGACEQTFRHEITIIESSFADAGADITLNPESLSTLGGNPSGSNGSEYLWLPNIALHDNTVENPSVVAPISVSYTLHTTKNGCVVAGQDAVMVNGQ